MYNAFCLDAIPTPELSDEAVVYIHDALHNYLELFESHYGDQLRRYYDERSQDNLVPPINPSSNSVDEPF